MGKHFLHSLVIGVLACLTNSKAYAQSATLSFSSVEGASGSTGAAGSTTEPLAVFGGIVGPDCTTGLDGTNVCDNCTVSNTCATTADPANTLCACNRSRIYGNLALRIFATQSSGTANLRAYYSTASSTQTEFPVVDLNNSSVAITWANICGAMGNQDCKSVTTENRKMSITIYADTDSNNSYTSGEPTLQIPVTLIAPGDTDYNVFGAENEGGIETFTPYPGDGKIYMEKLEAGSGSYPNMAYGGTAQNLVVYISNESLKKATPKDSLPLAVLPISTDGKNLEDNVVDGLDNGTLYFFRIAIQDEAGNIVQFMPALTLTGDDETNCNTTPSSSCPYSATPDEVQGLLSKDFNCFIATAAFGTNFGPQLKAFRDFRKYILLPTSWGRWLVNNYYHYGPYAARYILDKPVVRAAVRTGLYPFYGFSLFALRYGLAWALTVTFAISVLITVGAVWTVRKVQARA